jgi:hypothetical protein
MSALGQIETERDGDKKGMCNVMIRNVIDAVHGCEGIPVRTGIGGKKRKQNRRSYISSSQIVAVETRPTGKK